MTRVVGLSHYSSKVVPGEVNFDTLWRTSFVPTSTLPFFSRFQRVFLARDHRNNHDQWAIRVGNLHGDQVGYVAREEALDLAPLIDSGVVVYQAIIPSNSTGG